MKELMEGYNSIEFERFFVDELGLKKDYMVDFLLNIGM